MKRALLLFFLAGLMLCITGCATVPNGGFYGDIDRVGSRGPLLGNVRIQEGMLVKSVVLDPETTINLQINELKVEKEPLLYDHILTIGKFSTVLGSGFAKKENIYYEKRISGEGKDFFEVDGKTYLVEWKRDDMDPITYILPDLYTVKVSGFTRPTYGSARDSGGKPGTD